MAFWQKDPFRELRREIGKDKVATSPEELTLYGFDATTIRGKPAAVIFPDTTSSSEYCQLCEERKSLYYTSRSWFRSFRWQCACGGRSGSVLRTDAQPCQN